MKKINLFFILATKEQTYKFEGFISDIKAIENKKLKKINTTLELHYFMLSKYFNLYNFFKYQNKIKSFENAIIYHLPIGLDSLMEGIEEILLKFKGNIPIVYRSYDPHSPLKMSKKYMTKYHDLILTYLNVFADNKNIISVQTCYDNHLFLKPFDFIHRTETICMILRNRTGKEHNIEKERFTEIDLDLVKTYKERAKVIKFQILDIYGQGWSKKMKNYKGSLYPHEKKFTTLTKYKFNLILENAIVDNWLSEKILDSFLSFSVPVYLGSPVTYKYIPKECFINVADFKNYEKLFSYLENMSENEYNKYIENIKKYRTEIFANFSTKINFAIPVYKWYKENYNKNLSVPDFDKEDEKILLLKYKKHNPISDFIKRGVKKINKIFKR